MVLTRLWFMGEKTTTTAEGRAFGLVGAPWTVAIHSHGRACPVFELSMETWVRLTGLRSALDLAPLHPFAALHLSLRLQPRNTQPTAGLPWPFLHMRSPYSVMSLICSLLWMKSICSHGWLYRAKVTSTAAADSASASGLSNHAQARKLRH